MGATDTELAFPIPEPPPSVRPASAPFAFEVSVSQHIVRDTSTTLQDIARGIVARVSYPVIFIGGAALGILIACLFVAVSRPSATSTAAAAATVAAPFEPTWAPLPVVTIHPAPPEAVETLPVAEPAPTPPPPAPAPVEAKARVRRFVKKERPQSHVALSSTAHDLLAAAL